MRLGMRKSGVLLLSVISATAALALLLIAGWFIAASALAGLSSAALVFNYVVPSTFIRLLAFLRIIAGYGYHYFAHDLLLQKLNQLRQVVFDNVMSERKTTPKAEDMETLEQRVAVIANVDIGVFMPMLTGFTLVLGVAMVLWLRVNGLELFSFVVIFLLGALWWLRRRFFPLISHLETATENYRSCLEHQLQGASMWSLRDGVALIETSSNAFSQAWLTIRALDSRGEWGLHFVSLAALMFYLIFIPHNLLGSAQLILLPLVFLTLPDWFGPSLRGVKPGVEASVARHAAVDLVAVAQHVCPEPVTASNNMGPVTSLQLTEFCWLRGARLGQAVNTLLARGEIVGIEGDSGCGKSSLLMAVAGLLKFKGKLLVNGENQAGALNAFAHILYCEQHPRVLADTLRNNLRIAKNDATDMEIAAALDFACLSHLNDSLNQWLGEQGRLLSGGERKRLGVARAWLANRDLWLLDEPFEGLDSLTQKKLAEHLNRIKQDKIILVVSHQPVNALDYDRWITL